MKEEHGNSILKRIRKRMRGLVATFMVAALMVSVMPCMNAFADEEPDKYYFVMIAGNHSVLICSGKEDVGEVITNGYGQHFGYENQLIIKEGSSLKRIGYIEKNVPSNSVNISPENDVTVYFGTISGGQMELRLNGESKDYNNGAGNAKSFTLPAGKYSVQHTGDIEYYDNKVQKNRNRWIIEINSLISEIALSSPTLEFTVGDEAKTLTVTPEDAEVEWKSSNASVATVDIDGKVIPVGPGKAIITATLKDNDTVSANCEVTVSTGNEGVSAHTHTFVYKEAKESTYTEAGYKAHYECAECHVWAEDANGAHVYTEEEMKALIISPKTRPNESSSSSSNESSSSSSNESSSSGSSSNSSDSDSDSDSSGGGSKGKAGSISTKSIDVNGNTVQTQPDSGAPLSDRGGNWGNQEYSWTYTKSDGSLAKGEWLNLEYDGHTYWYYFDDSTIMQTNWFDYNGSRYFLVPEMDGWRGRMATGWHQVDNKWYYFEPTVGANQGILYRGMTTPDGHTVGVDGAWDGNGTTPIGAIHTGTTITMN